MVHLSTSTALYLAAATLLGAVVLPASLDFAATNFGALPSIAQDSASAWTPAIQERDAKAKPASIASAWINPSE